MRRPRDHRAGYLQGPRASPEGRNLFAHKVLMKGKGPALEKVSFGIQQIADLCKSLVFVSQHMDLTRFGTGPRRISDSF